MRFMIIVKATPDTEAGVMPEEALMADMATYHEALAKAGVLLDASGLLSSAKGWRIQYQGGQTQRDRRTFHRIQGADRRLHPDSGQIPRRGPRMDPSLSKSRG